MNYIKNQGCGASHKIYGLTPAPALLSTFKKTNQQNTILFCGQPKLLEGNKTYLKQFIYVCHDRT